MAKTQTKFVCQSCGHESPRWLGRCPECEAWSTFIEEVQRIERPRRPTRVAVSHTDSGPSAITEVGGEAECRLLTGIGELDRVLGGGIVPGAVMLVGGDPGIGKSTLLTHVAYRLTTNPPFTLPARRNGEDGNPLATQHSLPNTVLYVSGEESLRQIRLRCERLGTLAEGFLVVNETEIGTILHYIENIKPTLVVIDSIQTTYDPALDSAPGTVSQVRDCAAVLTRVAKAEGLPIFLIGHVTKEGTLAGPRVLEHMVDAVLYFEGDRHHAYRLLRAVKNRFGATDEIGIFEMCEEGLTEVSNPSAALLAERTIDSSGSAIAPTLEGTRPLLVEIQALVTRSFLTNPRRTSTGIDLNRVHMLLAVLEKRVGLRLGEQDVYVNVAGGVRIVEPATDLAVTMAVASSFREQPIDPSTVLIGEVGLGGEVRGVAQVEKRLCEAARLGFRQAILSRHNMGRLPKGLGVEIVAVSNVVEAMNAALLPVRDGFD
jgi:DNA repair protein RadA/Sms